MDKVVILARVSTFGQSERRQVVELTEYCNRVGWQIEKVFENKISGAKKNEDRPEIMELIDYVKSHDISRVVVLEISRLGRNTLEALKVINILNEHKISLYIKNYNLETLNPDGSVNPVASLISTILLEVANMERLTTMERCQSGYRQYRDKCRKEGIKMGRPSTYRKSEEEYRTQYKKEISLLRTGMSLRNVQKITGTSINTLRKLGSFL